MTTSAGACAIWGRPPASTNLAMTASPSASPCRELLLRRLAAARLSSVDSLVWANMRTQASSVPTWAHRAMATAAAKAPGKSPYGLVTAAHSASMPKAMEGQRRSPQQPSFHSPDRQCAPCHRGPVGPSTRAALSKATQQRSSVPRCCRLIARYARCWLAM